MYKALVILVLLSIFLNPKYIILYDLPNDLIRFHYHENKDLNHYVPRLVLVSI
jgi:hypothetical protein